MVSSSRSRPDTHYGGAIPLASEIDVVEDIAGELEDFTLLSRLGLYDEASGFLEENLKLHIDNFSVFIEYADMLRAAGRFDELLSHLCHPMHTTELYLEIIITASKHGPFAHDNIDFKIPESQYQPPGPKVDKTSSARWEGFIERCWELNKKERYWEAQRILTLLLPELDSERVDQFFQEYLEDLETKPLTSSTALARLAACNVFLKQVSLHRCKWMGNRKLSSTLHKAVNIGPCLSYLFWDLKVVKGCQFEEWQNAILKLVPEKHDEQDSAIRLLGLRLTRRRHIPDTSGISLLLEAATRYGKPPLIWTPAELQSTHMKTIFLKAAEEGHEAAMKYFLDYQKADLNVQNKGGRTALILAAIKGHEAIIRSILNTNGANPDLADHEGRTPLSWAASKGQLTIAQRLLGIPSVDPDSTDKSGRTPLSWAASEGQLETAQILLGISSVDPDSTDKSGRTPLSWAASKGQLTIAQRLLGIPGVDPDSIDRDGRTPLSWAASKGHTSVVRMFLADTRVNVNFPDVHHLTPVFWAIKSGKEDPASLLLHYVPSPDQEDSDSRTLLSHAAASGLESIVRPLLNRVKNPDAEDKFLRTPLSYAAEKGHLHIAQLLLDKADLNRMDRYGLTPLTYASFHGHEAIVKVLLDNADPNLKDLEGLTALMYASHHGYNTVVELLLEKVDPDLKDNRGWTALMHACDKGHETVVKLLLETRRVNPDWIASYNWTARRRAQLHGYESIVSLLDQFPRLH
ncbi:uncharacterized protein KD926_004427 [Aspergillus affinis]|uniref:uncharacterized protein n=1 Tax=Aspergillus affinis TaxID=1070780 RepID=UPI0022FE681A|nr:uncharacterized protein KD926_004427 [Aspergillus affinis]KAI9043243.1 hypothetical protein KD926_004427 [Aspergillus affinis]